MKMGARKLFLAIERCGAADERAAAQIESQRPVRLPGDADADALADVAGLAAVSCQKERAIPAQIESVEPAVDPHRLGETSGSTRQIAQALSAAVFLHDVDA